MPSLKAIRTRIRSVRNMQKITQAMKMVAAAKLRRAQDSVVRARPYAQALETVLAQVATREEAEAHPLLAIRPPKRVEIVVLTSDRGLCGGFNSNVVRRLQRLLVDGKDRWERVTVSTIGRRGRDFSRKRGVEIRKDYAGVLGHLEYPKAQAVADDLVGHFLAEDLDAVYLLYNRFHTAMTQKITVSQLLPIRPGTPPGEPQEKGPAAVGSDFVYEPSRTGVLEALLPRHMGMQIWRAMLESEASEHGARMTAMDSATRNARDAIGRLTLSYNRARQATITKELMEIIAGAEALK